MFSWLDRIRECAAIVAGRPASRVALRWASPDSTHDVERLSGSADSAQYSALRQIDRSNVHTLKVAWTYPTLDQAGYSFNPIVVDGVIYVLAKNLRSSRLTRRPEKNCGCTRIDEADHHPRHQLLGKHGSVRTAGSCSASNEQLKAIDARTGQAIPSFGKNGKVDLRDGLDRDPATIAVQSATPGRVFENLIILGSARIRSYDSAPGDIHAYDVRTGKLSLDFPHDSARRGIRRRHVAEGRMENRRRRQHWGELSVDEKRGIVYIPIGSPNSTSTAATARATICSATACSRSTREPASASGTSRWSTTTSGTTTTPPRRSSSPCGTTARWSTSSRRPARQGFLYVFDRVTGEPLWPIEERPVPQSDLPGEETWPTQPFPTAPPPFARQTFTANDLNPFIDDTAERERFLDESATPGTTGCSRRPACATPSRCPATTADRIGAAPPSTPNAARCSSCPRIFPAC